MEDLQVVLESCWFEPLQEVPVQHSTTPPTAASLKPRSAEVHADLSTVPYSMVTPQSPSTTKAHVTLQPEKTRKSKKKSRGFLGRNRSKKGRERVEVVRKSCAVLPSVVVTPTSSSFTFMVGDEFVGAGEWRLQCRVGVCSPGSLPRPAINKCTKPSSYCKKEDLMRLFQDQAAASQLQNVQFGPIIFQSNDADPSVRTTDGSSAQSVLVMKGVATEMVFVISFVSFVVGVALTSLLWFLHSKFGCSQGCKSGLRSLEPPHGGACAVPNSGGSTPSSQAPMTVGG
ncbi:hypothetical protein FHG87_016075 [Trinorchestia longiramus]|nr:hypothetical protein FHG87_016075 [Trinorchestia longiramus]